MKIKEVLDSMKNIELAVNVNDNNRLNTILRLVVTDLNGQGFTIEQIKEYISSKIDKI
jgi:hypothetical protein